VAGGERPVAAISVMAKKWLKSCWRNRLRRKPKAHHLGGVSNRGGKRMSGAAA